VKTFAVLAATSIALGSVACVIGEEHHEVIYYDPHKTSSTLTCKTDDFTKVKTDGLKECGKGRKGQGHCYDRMKVEAIGGAHDPKGENDYETDECEDTEICVPDKILAANGKPLQKCDWNGNPGVCMSGVAKRISDNWVALKRLDCEGEDEVCTPCKDPTAGNRDTHTCGAMGVHSDDCTGGKGASGVSLCCNGLGLCTEKDGVPDGKADQLPKDSCKKDSQVCAPAAMIDNKPEKCELPGGFDGVCLPYCFADMFEGAKAGVRSSCNALSFCLPCAVGKSQGMPGCE
jgi:hypothetical protein